MSASATLLAQFRDEMDDAAAPYLWSDALIYSYIDDAQTMFCRLTDGIPDGTTVAVTQIEVLPATEWYDTHHSILKIREAYRTDTGKPLAVMNHEDMASQNMRFDGRTGPLGAMIIGIEDYKVRVWPVPNETVTVQMNVFRLPLVAITGDAAMVVAPQHLINLLDWVKFRAYSKQNAETFDRTRAKEFEDKFRAYCKAAKDEQHRAKHKPRAVVYGGI